LAAGTKFSADGSFAARFLDVPDAVCAFDVVIARFLIEQVRRPSTVARAMVKSVRPQRATRSWCRGENTACSRRRRDTGRG
jgi:hypothetical protein